MTQAQPATTGAKPSILARVMGKQNKGGTVVPINHAGSDEERREAREAAEAAADAAPAPKPIGAAIAELNADKSGKRARTQNNQADAELDALIGELTGKTDQAVAQAKAAREQGEALLRSGTEYKEASGDDRFKVKNQALAYGVVAMEGLDMAMAKLKSLRKAHMDRLTGTYGFEAGHIGKCIKERKQPAQLVLEFFKTERKAVDFMHEILQAHGVARKGDEADEAEQADAKKARKAKGKKGKK